MTWREQSSKRNEKLKKKQAQQKYDQIIRNKNIQIGVLKFVLKNVKYQGMIKVRIG